MRYYDTASGRFTTKDIWEGNKNKPISLNQYIYGYTNPIKYNDPSGQMPIYCMHFDQYFWEIIPGCPGSGTSSMDEELLSPCPEKTPHTDYKPLPSKSSAWYAKTFYEMLRKDPGPWQYFRNRRFGMRTYIAIIFIYEMGRYGYSEDMEARYTDSDVERYLPEAFARRMWDARKKYGPDGIWYYLGGREMIIHRVDAKLRDKNYKFLQNWNSKDWDLALSAADKILNLSIWKSGIQEKAPYDWGNPQYNDPWKWLIQEFFDTLEKPRSEAQGPDYNQILHIAPDYQFVIVTKEQSDYLCYPGGPTRDPEIASQHPGGSCIYPYGFP
jgi:hypothetical protein